MLKRLSENEYIFVTKIWKNMFLKIRITTLNMGGIPFCIFGYSLYIIYVALRYMCCMNISYLKAFEHMC